MDPQWIDNLVGASDWFALVVMLVSLAGLVIPIFPGIVIIWLTAFVSVVINGGTVGWVLFVVLTVLTIAGTLVDNILMGAKAKEQGASWYAIGLALIAGVVGTFIFPPIGGIIAAPLMLFVVEYARQKEVEKAWEVVKALMIGWGWSFVARFGIGVVMVVIWGIWAFTN